MTLPAERPENLAAFEVGYQNTAIDIALMGWPAAARKFNMDNPTGDRQASMEAYFHAKGELQALVDSM